MSKCSEVGCRCPSYRKTQCQLAGFEKIAEFKNAGLTIYRHSLQGNESKSKYEQKQNEENVFIFHNTKDADIQSADFLPEMEKKAIKCPRCRRIMDHALNILQKVSAICKNEVIGICDHCKLKQQPCFECVGAVKKFFDVKKEAKETVFSKKQLGEFLSKVQDEFKGYFADRKRGGTQILKDYVDDERKVQLKAKSDEHIDQLCRWKYVKGERELNIKDLYRESERRGLIKPPPTDADKAKRQVAFKTEDKYITYEPSTSMFSIERKAKSALLKSKLMHDERYVKPTISKIDEVEILPTEDGSEKEITDQKAQQKIIMESEPKKLTEPDETKEKDYFKIIEKKSEVKKDFDFSFPRDIKETHEDRKQISSTELIHDVHDKIKEKTEEKKRKEEVIRQKKIEAEEKRLAALKEKEMKDKIQKEKMEEEMRLKLAEDKVSGKRPAIASKESKSVPEMKDTKKTLSATKLKAKSEVPKESKPDETKGEGKKLKTSKSDTKESKAEHPKDDTKYKDESKSPKGEIKERKDESKGEPKPPKGETKPHKVESKGDAKEPKPPKSEPKPPKEEPKPPKGEPKPPKGEPKPPKDEPKPPKSEPKPPKDEPKPTKGEPKPPKDEPKPPKSEPKPPKDEPKPPKGEPKPPKGEPKPPKGESKPEKEDIKVKDTKGGKRDSKEAKRETKDKADEKEPKHDLKKKLDTPMPPSLPKPPKSDVKEGKTEAKEKKSEAKDAKSESKEPKSAKKGAKTATKDIDVPKSEKDAKKSEPRAGRERVPRSEREDVQPEKDKKEESEKIEKETAKPEKPIPQKIEEEPIIKYGKDIVLRSPDEKRVPRRQLEAPPPPPPPKKVKRELKVKQIQMLKPSQNLATLEMVKFTGGSGKKERTISQLMTQSQIFKHFDDHKGLKTGDCLMCIHSNLEFEYESRQKHKAEMQEIIDGRNIKYVADYDKAKDEETVKPLLFQLKYDDQFKAEIVQAALSPRKTRQHDASEKPEKTVVRVCNAII